jgi:hypothetical protein
MSGNTTKVLNQPVITDFSLQPTSIESDYDDWRGDLRRRRCHTIAGGAALLRFGRADNRSLRLYTRQCGSKPDPDRATRILIEQQSCSRSLDNKNLA